MEIEKLKSEEITSNWIKENLCMDDGNDITECYHELIAFNLKNWEYLNYKNVKEVLNRFHLIIK